MNNKSFLSTPGSHYFDVEGSLVVVKVTVNTGFTVNAYTPKKHPFSIGSVLKNGSEITKEEFETRLSTL